MTVAKNIQRCIVSHFLSERNLRYTSLTASLTERLIISSYRSAARCISGSSGQCSSTKSAYSQHLHQRDGRINRNLTELWFKHWLSFFKFHSFIQVKCKPGTQRCVSVILSTICYSREHTGNFAVAQHLGIQNIANCIKFSINKRFRENNNWLIRKVPSWCNYLQTLLLRVPLSQPA